MPAEGANCGNVWLENFNPDGMCPILGWDVNYKLPDLCPSLSGSQELLRQPNGQAFGHMPFGSPSLPGLKNILWIYMEFLTPLAE